MDNINLEFLNKIFNSDTYSIIITITAIVLLIITIYNKIKFVCLQKASEMVARAEERIDLTGEEKFLLCVFWINNSLPTLFRNELVKSIIEKMIDFAYNNSFKYATKYIKRKTGFDIEALCNDIKKLKEEETKEEE